MQSPGEAAYIKSYIGQMYVKCSSKSRKQHRNNYYTITNKTCPFFITSTDFDYSEEKWRACYPSHPQI